MAVGLGRFRVVSEHEPHLTGASETNRSPQQDCFSGQMLWLQAGQGLQSAGQTLPITHLLSQGDY